MVDPEIYIKEGLKIVKALMAEGNLPMALRTCQELLKVNPYHRKVQKYLKEIEERIVKQNEKKVEADIEATMHLWKEERFDDLMKIYVRLYQYAPQHARLQKLIAKLNEKLSAQQKNVRGALIHESLAKIQTLLREEKFGDTIQAGNELLRVDPLNSEAAAYLKKAKNGLIEQKLKDGARITESADFDRQLEFFNSLLAIDPEHKEVKRLALRAQSHVAEQKMIAEKIHLNESVARMKELFKNGEYEMVLQSCEEIERLDPGNFTARVFRKKAKRTIRAEIEILTVKLLKETWKGMEPEYQKNPKGFVKM